MNPSPISNRPGSPWRRAAKSKRQKSPGFLAPLVLALGLISSVVLAIVGVKTDGFGLQTHTEWRRYEADLAALGEPVWFDSMVPSPVADEENVFSDPLFLPLTTPTPAIDPNSLLAMAQNPGQGITVESLLASSNDGSGRATLDTIATRMMTAGITTQTTDYLLPGDRILAGMNTMGFNFAPLQSAISRNSARFPLDYSHVESPEFPHHSHLESLGDWLAIRAIASISTGDSATAATDLLMVARLAELTAGEPFLESQRCRRKLLDIFCSGVMTGITRDVWSSSELLSFRAAIQNANPTNDVLLAMRGERARLNTAIESALMNPSDAASPLIETWTGSPAAAFKPRALRSNQIVINTAIQQLIDRIRNPKWTEDNPAPVLDLPISARERLAVFEEEFATAKQSLEKVSETDAACAGM